MVVAACAHGPRREQSPAPAQLGCYDVRVDRGLADRDLPVWFREHIPSQIALAADRENGETFDPGWRLATLGGESGEAVYAIKDGAWWPVPKGGIEVRLGNGSSGVRLRLNAVVSGFDGEARTYQDVGDASFPAHVMLERVHCAQQPIVIDRRLSRWPP